MLLKNVIEERVGGESAIAAQKRVFFPLSLIVWRKSIRNCYKF